MNVNSEITLAEEEKIIGERLKILRESSEIIGERFLASALTDSISVPTLKTKRYDEIYRYQN